MFENLSLPHILMVLMIVMLLFGAKRIPEIAGSMGKGIREFKKNINDATREVTAETRAGEPESQSRLTAAELEQRRAVDEAERPAPKRLL